MQKKNLIIFMPSIEGGGVEKNLYIISNYLADVFNGVSLITISKKYKFKFKKSINFITLQLDIWDKFSRKIKYFLSLILLIKEFFKSRNVLVFAFQANIYCIILCKIFSVKVITRSNSAPSGWSKNFIKNYIFSLFLKKADKIIVNSQDFKKVLKRKFNINPVCVYNPLNTIEIKKLSKDKIKRIFPNNNNIKIINIGRYVDQKDQLTMLKSLFHIKKKINFNAVLLGRGVNKKKFENFIKLNNLNKNIKLINFKENPYPYLKQADIFILTSKFEGLPNVLLEALVLEKFVISSNCPTGPKEILSNGKGGLLFKVGDYRDLSDKIIFYKRNKNKCLDMLKYSIKNLHRFDYKKNLKNYSTILKPYLDLKKK